MAPAEKEDDYHPKDALKEGLFGTLILGGGGLVVASIQNALQKRNVGALAVFTRYGGTITTYAASGGVYAFSKAVAANLRRTDDHYNEAISGFMSGAVIGLTTGRMARVFGYGGFLAVILATFDYTGGKLSGWRTPHEIDEYDRKEYLRKNRRRPIEETLAECGEGRAIHPPGYEERRRQRLKEKYGLDIKPVSMDPNQA